MQKNRPLAPIEPRPAVDESPLNHTI